MNPIETIPTLNVIDQYGQTGVECLAPCGRVAPQPPPAFAHDPDRPTFRYLDRYAAWRRTKCRPVDPACIGDNLRDLDQATHEFVGEVAELGELILAHGAEAFAYGGPRAKLLNEIGDVFFTGSWLGDAWGRNPLLSVPRLDVANLLNQEQVRNFEGMRDRLLAPWPEARDDSAQAWLTLYAQVIAATTTAGLLANMYKKLRFQQRPQDPAVAFNRLDDVFTYCAKIALLAGATPLDCLDFNIRKLDHRYPEGYRPNSGGGDRTGVGA